MVYHVALKILKTELKGADIPYKDGRIDVETGDIYLTAIADGKDIPLKLFISRGMLDIKAKIDEDMLQWQMRTELKKRIPGYIENLNKRLVAEAAAKKKAREEAKKAKEEAKNDNDEEPKETARDINERRIQRFQEKRPEVLC